MIANISVNSQYSEIMKESVTEDREVFSEKLKEINETIALSYSATNIEEAKEAANKIGFPVLIRAAFAIKKDSIELEKMSGGKLADLCIASMIQKSDREAYTAFDVAGLPIDACSPTIEQGRLEVRLSALFDALNRSSY